MHQQLVVVLFLGFIASISALDLSHAVQPAAEVDPRIFSFINDFYAQVVYPPLNHIVTNTALLAAQVLAGVAANGLPAPGSRAVLPNDPRFIDAITQALNSVFSNVIQKPLEDALSNGALILAQVLAGLGTNGVDLSTLGSLFGKRDLSVEEQARFIDAFTQALNSVFSNVIQKPLEDALSNGALILAQVLAGLGTNGVDLSTLGSLFGKRDLSVEEQARFIDAITQALNSVFSNVIQKPLEDALSNGALILAQVLAGLGTNGVDLSTLGSLFGKRDLSVEEQARFIDAFTQALNSVFSNVIQKPLEDALSNGALILAQVLAGLGTNGVDLSTLGSLFGKRSLTAQDARGPIIDSLVDHANDLFTTQVKPVLEGALNAAALHLAGVLANFSQNGFGRR